MYPVVFLDDIHHIKNNNSMDVSFAVVVHEDDYQSFPHWKCLCSLQTFLFRYESVGPTCCLFVFVVFDAVVVVLIPVLVLLLNEVLGFEIEALLIQFFVVIFWGGSRCLLML